jgi:putative intracellular protease/amidase
LVVLAPGAEEMEALSVPDVLVRAGCAVTVAGTAPGTHPAICAGSRGLPLASQVGLDAVLERAFDLVYLPGGMGSARTCRDDARIQGLIARRLHAGLDLAIICASPIALLPAGLARGRRLTCFPALRGELEAGGAHWLDQPVVTDGCLITSQGAGTALALGLALAARLCGRERAAAVAAEMLASPQLQEA